MTKKQRRPPFSAIAVSALPAGQLRKQTRVEAAPAHFHDAWEYPGSCSTNDSIDLGPLRDSGRADIALSLASRFDDGLQCQNVPHGQHRTVRIVYDMTRGTPCIEDRNDAACRRTEQIGQIGLPEPVREPQPVRGFTAFAAGQIQD